MRRVILTAAVALAAGFASGARAADKLEFSIQGQVGAGETARDVDTDVNVVYGAILGLHFAGPLGLELDYQHAENDVSGTAGLATVKQDGVFGHVRFDLGRGQVVPFLYAGAGWVHFRGSASALSESVDRLVIPAGAGLEFHARPLVVGARIEYQWNTDEIASQNIDYWKAVGTIGFRF
jgi:hypothetical protein